MKSKKLGFSLFEVLLAWFIVSITLIGILQIDTLAIKNLTNLSHPETALSNSSAKEKQ